MPHSDAKAGSQSIEMQVGVDFLPSTHWSVILAANGNDTPAANAAMDALFRAYQRPLYSYIRRRGTPHHDAQDLLQSFFGRLLVREVLRSASQQRGKFRSFLLASLKNFLFNEYDRAHALKRGGSQVHFSLDATELACIQFDEPTSGEPPPDSLFDREWAGVIFSKALSQLEQEFVGEGKQAQFTVLAPFLSRPPGAGEYERMAASAGIRPALMATVVLRLRQRFRDLVRAEVAATVSTPAEVDEELSYLVRLMTA